MLNKLFGILGGGDTMTGMQYAMFIFMGIIGMVLLFVMFNLWRNHNDDKKKSSVSLTSKVAVKKKEERKKGVFNYDLLNKNKPEEEPREERHIDLAERRLKPITKPHAKVSIPSEDVKGVSLKKADTPQVDMHKSGHSIPRHAHKHDVMNHDDNPFASPIEPSSLRKDDNNE